MGLLPEADNIELTKVGGPGKEFWIFGENFPNAPRPNSGNEYEIGAWRIELSPSKPSAEDLFLNVMQIGGAPLAARRIDAGEFVGARIANSIAFFHRDGTRADRAVSFVLDGASQVKVLVTDLAEGTWQVRLDGRIVQPAITVTAEAGVLFFEGPPGRYELRR